MRTILVWHGADTLETAHALDTESPCLAVAMNVKRSRDISDKNMTEVSSSVENVLAVHAGALCDMYHGLW